MFHWIILLFIISFWDLWDILFWILIFLLSFIFYLHFFKLLKFVWTDYRGGLSNSFHRVLFLKSSIFSFLDYVSVNIRRSDRWSLSLFICWFGHRRIFFGYFLICVSIWFDFCTRFSLFYFYSIHSFNVFLKCWPLTYTQIYYFSYKFFILIDWCDVLVFLICLLSYISICSCPHIAFNNFPGFWKRILFVFYH